MALEKTVLVLGGGVGGLVAANRLRQRLPRKSRVVLIDRAAHHLFQPSLLWVLTGTRDREKITKPLDRLRRKGIDVIAAEIAQIDPVSRSVRTDGQEWTGDALLVCLGADLAPELVPGLAAAGHDLYTLEGATALRDSLREFRSGRNVVLTATPAYKCPAAPYEAAMLIEWLCRRRGIREEVRIDLYAAEAAPLGVAGPEVSAGVRAMVEAKGIAYHPEHPVTAVEPAARRIAFSNGVEASYDLLGYVPPHRAPDVVRAAGLTDDSGWIPVDRHTLETGHPSVFALGDVTVIPLQLGKPLPKAGVFAHGQAEVVARNLARAWTGKGEPASFDGYGECFVETGDGRAGFGSGNFYAEPTPRVSLRSPSRWRHWGKVLFEKRWLWEWF